MGNSKLITKHQLSLVLQVFKKLLTFKPDREEVVLRSEIEEQDALEILMEMNMVAPVMADDGSVYVDENGAMYSL
jgi:hypothetical protein